LNRYKAVPGRGPVIRRSGKKEAFRRDGDAISGRRLVLMRGPLLLKRKVGTAQDRLYKNKGGEQRIWRGKTGEKKTRSMTRPYHRRPYCCYKEEKRERGRTSGVPPIQEETEEKEGTARQSMGSWPSKGHGIADESAQKNVSKKRRIRGRLPSHTIFSGAEVFERRFARDERSRSGVERNQSPTKGLLCLEQGSNRRTGDQPHRRKTKKKQGD